jgi:hypothetical protein
MISEQFYLSPNPASDVVRVKNVLGTPFSYSVISADGKTVAKGEGAGTSTILPVDLLSPVSYIISIDCKGKKGQRLKFVLR